MGPSLRIIPRHGNKGSLKHSDTQTLIRAHTRMRTERGRERGWVKQALTCFFIFVESRIWHLNSVIDLPLFSSPVFFSLYPTNSQPIFVLLHFPSSHLIFCRCSYFVSEHSAKKTMMKKKRIMSFSQIWWLSSKTKTTVTSIPLWRMFSFYIFRDILKPYWLN